jgi:hypothetical protein
MQVKMERAEERRLCQCYLMRVLRKAVVEDLTHPAKHLSLARYQQVMVVYQAVKGTPPDSFPFPA